MTFLILKGIKYLIATRIAAMYGLPSSYDAPISFQGALIVVVFTYKLGNAYASMAMRGDPDKTEVVFASYHVLQTWARCLWIL